MRLDAATNGGSLWVLRRLLIVFCYYYYYMYFPSKPYNYVQALGEFMR